MKKYMLLLVLYISCNVDAQYLKKEYPLIIQHSFRNDFNVKFSVSRNTDFEGAESLFFEMSSFSFAIIENRINSSELIFSLNPIIWCLSTLTNNGQMVNSGGGLPLLSVFLQGIPNSRVEIILYKNLMLSLGIDTDYLITKKSLGIRGAGNIGLKYQLDRFSLRLLYNWEAVDFMSFYEDYNTNGLRIDISYDFGNFSFSKFIYHCGYIE